MSIIFFKNSKILFGRFCAKVAFTHRVWYLSDFHFSAGPNSIEKHSNAIVSLFRRVLFQQRLLIYRRFAFLCQPLTRLRAGTEDNDEYNHDSHQHGETPARQHPCTGMLVDEGLLPDDVQNQVGK